MTGKEKIEKLEAELAQLKEEAKSFSYIVSHDLRQPVRGMMNYVNFTLEDFEHELNSEVVDNLKQALKQYDRFDVMMDGMLELSRLNSYSKEKIRFNFEEIANSVINEFLKEELFEFVINGSASFIGDPILISTLFGKIIQNSIVYNVEQEKNIEINISESVQEVCIVIRDNGIGINPKYSKEIFNVFSRLNGQFKFGSRSGTGLTIALKIMELHDGEIKFNNKEIGTEIELVFNK